MTSDRNRYLFIVSRDTAPTAAYLLEHFGEESEVEIIVDRRRGNRRAGTVPAWTPERRIEERRRRLFLDAELRLAPYVFVALTGGASTRSDTHDTDHPGSSRDGAHPDLGPVRDGAVR
jgi:hypothetical protein